MEPTVSKARGAPFSRWDALALGVLLAAIAAFTWGWTAFGWQLYLSLRLPIFDFGINYQNIWAAAHGTRLDFFGVGIGSLILYTLVPAYWLITPEPSFFLFLIAFQAAWLAAGSIPLFLVARERLGNRWAALALSLSYLLFPALSGTVWFPFHFEAFFPTLFLLGYWQYRRGAKPVAGAFWTAALFTHIGATIVLGAFAVGILAEPRLTGGFAWARRGVDRWILRRPRRSATLVPAPGWRRFTRSDALGIYLLAASAFVFIVLASFFGWFWFLHYVTKSGPDSVSYTQPFWSPPALGNVPVQAWTILLLLGPLFALPLLGREERWATFPYFAVLLFTSQTGFWFPFRNQYPMLLVPALFAATLRGMERLQEWKADREPVAAWIPTEPARRAWSRPRSLPRPAVTAGLILGVVVVSCLFLSPWGPFNPLLASNSFLSPGYFNDAAPYSTNLTLDAQLRALAASVPTSGVLLTQNDLSQPLDREYFTIPSRYTTAIPLDYLLTDPYSSAFYAHNLNGPLPTSMMGWTNYFLEQGWGVYGEADGALVLAANYSGPLHTYYPVDQWFLPSAFPCCTPSGPLWNSSGHGNWVGGPSVPFDGAYNVFSPGTYNLTLTLSVDHPLARRTIPRRWSPRPTSPGRTGPTSGER
ncbi:MAG: DUF2079 domain-containing protein [Thermoplasmata archaeon]|nr:DUF2079 domain-containing protein [Thermoplasmata archaeon]